MMLFLPYDKGCLFCLKIAELVSGFNPYGKEVLTFLDVKGYWSLVLHKAAVIY